MQAAVPPRALLLRLHLPAVQLAPRRACRLGPELRLLLLVKSLLQGRSCHGLEDQDWQFPQLPPKTHLCIIDPTSCQDPREHVG